MARTLGRITVPVPPSLHAAARSTTLVPEYDLDLAEGASPRMAAEPCDVSPLGSRADQEPRTDFARYLHEISGHALLTRDEETRLFVDLEAGVLAAEDLAAADRDEMSAEDRHALIEQVRLGAQARHRLIVSNLRLVVKVAKKHQNLGLALPDLIQEGSLGLMRAVDKFDYAKGYKFSTYAVWWIRKGIIVGLQNTSRTIRLPAQKFDLTIDYRKAIERLEQAFGRNPTTGEIAQVMGLGVDEVTQLAKIQAAPLSLDTPIGDSDDYTLSDLLPGSDDSDLLRTVEGNVLRRDLGRLLQKLEPEDRDLVIRLYGLAGNEPENHTNIAKELGVCRATILYRERKVLERLSRMEEVLAIRRILGASSCETSTQVAS